MTAYEYRIAWRRDGWADNTRDKTRVFQTREQAEIFLAKLDGDNRPDLSRIRIRLSHRPVVAWAEGWPK